MAHDVRTIVLNARRARYIADHLWNEAAGEPDDGVILEISLIRTKIEHLMGTRPEFREKLAVLYQEMTTIEFWNNLAANMEGTHFAVCGLEFQNLMYPSALRALWDLDENDSSASTSSARSRWKRKWGCHPIGCLGRMGKLCLKLLLPAWLIMYTVKLWSPPYGDAQKQKVSATKIAEQTVARKGQEAVQVGGALAVGTRVVAKKEIPIYRFNEEKTPVVAGRVPPGTVVEVMGAGNAKVVRVSVELPNGKKGKGLARVADLEE